MISADFIAAGLHIGYLAFRRATIPDMWGQDMEVPDSILKLSGGILFLLISVSGDEAGDQEAKTLTPGAVMSGCTAH